MNDEVRWHHLWVRAANARVTAGERLRTSRALVEENHRLLDEHYRLRRQSRSVLRGTASS
ncbi:hypothetical protein AT728_40405 [Streptomyces silvensis]|uniref:Uncharacterized protein n=1 Tax=Streptomyces silvensis TaxID=1765722 RepID=A0A0W7XBR3_9ACTN|nr:hypothetical protein AT728_40405 [Streptomyces silvensis]